MKKSYKRRSFQDKDEFPLVRHLLLLGMTVPLGGNVCRFESNLSKYKLKCWPSRQARLSHAAFPSSTIFISAAKLHHALPTASRDSILSDFKQMEPS